MLTRFIAWLQSLFRTPSSSSFVRSRIEASSVRQQSQDAINQNLLGSISCPWHQERAKSCRFDKDTGVVQCDGCKRTTNMDGLLRRLRATDVYERAVE